MSSVTNSSSQSRTVEHVFNELEPQETTVCDLCKMEPAVYRWSRLSEADRPREENLPLCRVCAGMILLIGKAQ